MHESDYSVYTVLAWVLVGILAVSFANMQGRSNRMRDTIAFYAGIAPALLLVSYLLHRIGYPVWSMKVLIAAGAAFVGFTGARIGVFS
jgi:hypothetical protein